MIDLGSILTKHKNNLLSRSQMLCVTPLRIQIIGTVVLALDIYKKNGVGRERGLRNIAWVKTSIPTKIQYFVFSFFGNGDVDLLPLIFLSQLQIEE